MVGVCEDPVAPPHASWSVGEAVDAELVGTVETGAFAGGGLEGGAASDGSAWGAWGTGLAGLGGAPLDVALVGGGVIFGFGGGGVPRVFGGRGGVGGSAGVGGGLGYEVFVFGGARQRDWGGVAIAVEVFIGVESVVCGLPIPRCAGHLGCCGGGGGGG